MYNDDLLAKAQQGIKMDSILQSAIKQETDIDKRIKEKNISILQKNSIVYIPDMLFVPRDFDTLLLEEGPIVSLLMNDYVLSQVVQDSLKDRPVQEIADWANKTLNRGVPNFYFTSDRNDVDKSAYDRLNNIFDGKYSKRALEGFSWHLLRIPVYLWAIGEWKDSLLSYKYPEDTLNTMFNNDKTMREIFKDAKLRPKEEILQMANLIFRLKWAADEYAMKGQTIPSFISSDYVLEYCEAFRLLLQWYNGGDYKF